MVGQVGTDQMSGVSIVIQLFFVFNLSIFGGISGAGIFSAQYYGKGSHEGVRQTFRFKIITCILIAVIGLVVLTGFDKPLIDMFLKPFSDAEPCSVPGGTIIIVPGEKG